LPLIVRVSEKHRKMSLAGFDVYRFGGRELWVNDNNSESDIIKYVGDFLTDYLKNIIWNDKDNPPGHYGQEVF
jgi:hypothetical protein